MHITVQTCYDIQYITMRLSSYMNSPTEPELISLRHGMEYLMQHPLEPIIYSIKKILKLNESPYQCFFKPISIRLTQTSNTPTFSHIL